MASSEESPASGGEAAPPQPEAGGERKRKKRRGFLGRLWRGIFGGGGEDYEKRLQYLSKEENLVHRRMRRRAQTSRKITTNFILFSVLLEVVAVVYAIMTTRSLTLTWQMRAIRVLPMFLLPALSSIIYSALRGFIRMLDSRDQKTLERLRTERQAKIDELKERTNYYSTQQLIQKYDLDPAAKAAAATVLASKLGADSGLRVYLGEENKVDDALGKSNDVQLVQSSGLRNRKQPHSKSHSGGSTGSPITGEYPNEYEPDGQENAAQNPKVVEHYKGPATGDGGWLARIAALLVGEDPTQCYALICGNCHMHNGLARKEDYPFLTYYCPHCHALNGSRGSQERRLAGEHVSSSGSSSGTPSTQHDGAIASLTSTVTLVNPNEAMGSMETAEDLLSELGKEIEQKAN